METPSDLRSLLSRILTPTKRRVFVSYHHDGDQSYYDWFSKTFSDTYEVISDNSLDRMIDSDNVDYIIQRIRNKCITGSSCTVVMCGRETPWRKYVDWEIKATLDKGHGLIGVNLPTNIAAANGVFAVPDRLHDNIQSGYAVWTSWGWFTQSTEIVKSTIEQAIGKPTSSIVNTREMMSRNGTPPLQR